MSLSLTQPGDNGSGDKAYHAKAERISKAEVMPGDILLLQYQPEDNAVAEAIKLLTLAKHALEDWKNWAQYDEEKRKQRFSTLMPLIHFAITAFDSDRFFHAAIVGLDKTGERIVVEAGTNGVMQSPLRDYWDGPISVYRYHKKTVVLGDKRLPAEPVLDMANALCRDRAIAYGYFHAGLLAVWCLFRAGEDKVMERLRAALVLALGEGPTDMLFTLVGPENIRLLLVDIFHKSLDRWRQDKHLVCSELVAVCYNQADELGTYEISRTLEKSSLPSSSALAGECTQNAVADLENAVKAVAEAMQSLEVERPLRAVDVTLALVSSDVLYTPSDLGRSISTLHIGDMGRS